MTKTLTFKHEMYISADGTISETQDELIRVRQERDKAVAQLETVTWERNVALHSYETVCRSLGVAALVEDLTKERDEARNAAHEAWRDRSVIAKERDETVALLRQARFRLPPEESATKADYDLDYKIGALLDRIDARKQGS